MASEEKITTVISLLHNYWSRNPQLRLGQIITNLSGDELPFYIEDTGIEERLRKELKEMSRDTL